jgi:hypothetical protein
LQIRNSREAPEKRNALQTLEAQGLRGGGAVLKSFIMVIGISVFFCSASYAGQIGDRLVVSINNQPYSQRQIEVYFSIKEILRDKIDASLLIANKDNWKKFLNLFIEDMIVLQEATRLGSFQINDAALEKYFGIIQLRYQKNDLLQANYSRLGIDSATLKNTLSNVLRVAGFRRSKSKMIDKSSLDELDEPRVTKRWLSELRERAVTRTFENAYKFKVIDPVKSIKK